MLAMLARLDATERKALTLSVFTAACLCFAPAEFISGGVLLLTSVALYIWDTRVTRRETERAGSAQQAEPGAVASTPAHPDSPCPPARPAP